jgi:hypothetical protein
MTIFPLNVSHFTIMSEKTVLGEVVTYWKLDVRIYIGKSKTGCKYPRVTTRLQICTGTEFQSYEFDLHCKSMFLRHTQPNKKYISCKEEEAWCGTVYFYYGYIYSLRLSLIVKFLRSMKFFHDYLLYALYSHVIGKYILMELSPSWEAANCAATQEYCQ